MMTVARIGQGAADDDAHRIVGIAALHLVFDGDQINAFVFFDGIVGGHFLLVAFGV